MAGDVKLKCDISVARITGGVLGILSHNGAADKDLRFTVKQEVEFKSHFFPRMTLPPIDQFCVSKALPLLCMLHLLLASPQHKVGHLPPFLSCIKEWM